jgi:hypothetical protein
MEKLDYKKAYKDLYMPKEKPTIIDVPPMTFIMVDGKGDPNDEGGEYQKATELLYGLSYTIKMSPKKGIQIEGFYDYVVPPLEGLWWMEGDLDLNQKSEFNWTSMIRQPDFVTKEVFQWACEEYIKKNPEVHISEASLQTFTEGLCVQMMHIGPFADEPRTLSQIEAYIEEQGFSHAIETPSPDGITKKHHEIYLSDPRKTAPEKLKTVIRHPIK